MMVDRSHKTAIKRKRLSAPARYLKEAGLLKGRILDFGCGRGFDADALGAEGFDPYYRTQMPDGKFDTIICIYVLNVIPLDAQTETLIQISRKLRRGGKAYIAVRRDLRKEGLTSKGTYQRHVQLEWKVLHTRAGAFCIYETRDPES
jgi:SAM-dependent methyltransferase